MATMVMGAPLLAGGPPGWVLYGLLGVGTLVVGAVVYRAARDAERTFPNTAPSPVQPCPRAEERPQSQSQPRVDPFPIPRVDDEPQRRNCRTEHPDEILCSNLPSHYRYQSREAAFRVLRDAPENRGHTLKMEKKDSPAERGPCPGRGKHISVRKNGKYLLAIVCCPCCTDTAGGPVLLSKCGIV